MGAKRKVIQFFVLIICFTVLLGIIQFSYFKGITGFVVSERQEISPDFSAGTFKGTETRDGKLFSTGSNDLAEYSSAILDLGAEVSVIGLDWEGQTEGSKVYYSLVEGSGEDEEVVMVSYDGKSWEQLRDAKKSKRLLGSKTKGDLVEEVSSEIFFELRVCEFADCEGVKFREVSDEGMDWKGRYVQYRIEFIGNSEETFINSVKVEYVPLNEGSIEEESLPVESTPLEDSLNVSSEIIREESNGEVKNESS